MASLSNGNAYPPPWTPKNPLLGPTTRQFVASDPAANEQQRQFNRSQRDFDNSGARAPFGGFITDHNPPPKPVASPQQGGFFSSLWNHITGGGTGAPGSNQEVVNTIRATPLPQLAEHVKTADPATVANLLHVLSGGAATAPTPAPSPQAP